MPNRPLTVVKSCLASFAVGLIPFVSTAIADEFTVHQQAPFIFERHLQGEGSGHVDIVGFEAGIPTNDGRAGVLSGILITVDIPEGAGEVFEDRIGNLAFDFGANNVIMVAGKSVYSMTKTEMKVGQPQVRAVVGGTGDYIGARGQVTTSRNADGTYAHLFELLD